MWLTNGNFASSKKRRNSASRWSRNICSRYRIRTSIPVTSTSRHVSWDSYIEVGGNRYSVPEALCGQPVSIRISLDDELRIYSNEKLVASHRLCSASSGWQTVPEHHAPLWQQVSQVEHRPLSAYEELL